MPNDKEIRGTRRSLNNYNATEYVDPLEENWNGVVDAAVLSVPGKNYEQRFNTAVDRLLNNEHN